MWWSSLHSKTETDSNEHLNTDLEQKSFKLEEKLCQPLQTTDTA